MYCNLDKKKVELTVRDIQELNIALSWAMKTLADMPAPATIHLGEGIAYRCTKGILERFKEKYDKEINATHIQGW